MKGVLNMKEDINKTERTCPICGKVYRGIPATSRENGEPICPDCGTREALSSIGVDEDEQKKILDIIHTKR